MEWRAAYDIASSLWQDIEYRSQRVVADVHRLAAAYAWSEADILAMSAARRRLYLAMIDA
jgi:hypothetical protein